MRKQKYYKVRYQWFPASAGFAVPADHQAISSTVIHAVSIRHAEESFARQNPHVKVLSARRFCALCVLCGCLLLLSACSRCPTPVYNQVRICCQEHYEFDMDAKELIDR